MSREKFEAWMTDEQWFHGSDFEWDERRNCYAQFGIHLAYKAWQAASKASEQQLSESRREFTAADATIHNLELKVAEYEEIMDQAIPDNSFTNEELEAMAHGDNPQANAYRELLAFRRNSPVTPYGWIPVSERMPDEIGRYWCYVEEQNSLGKSQYQWNCSWNGERWWVEGESGGRVTHWMELPAAPKEVG